MIEVTLSYEDMVGFVTGNGQQSVEEVGGQEIVDQEIERYRRTLERELGEGFRVEVSSYVLGTMINGLPAHYSEHAEQVEDAEADVVLTFW